VIGGPGAPLDVSLQQDRSIEIAGAKRAPAAPTVQAA
jgi:hypothetical protein